MADNGWSLDPVEVSGWALDPAVGPDATGLRQPGNIDILNRPIAHNDDGSISTVRSISIGTDRGEVLIPTVINGKVVSDKEAIDHYRRSGEHLGIFDNADHATAYAKGLHEQQASEYGHRGDWSLDPLGKKTGPLASAIEGQSVADNAAEADRDAALRKTASEAAQPQEGGIGQYVSDLGRSGVAGVVSVAGMGLRGLGREGERMRSVLGGIVGKDNADAFAEHWLAPSSPLTNTPLGAAGALLLNPSLSGALTNTGQAIQSVADTVNAPEERQNQVGNIIANATGQVAGMIALTMVGGESATNLSILGQSFDQIDQALKEKGVKDTSVAALTAQTVGAPVMSALERTGLDVILEGVPLKVKSRILRGFADIGIKGGFEAAEEVAQQVVQNFAVKLGVDPKTPVRDWPKQLGEGIEANAIGGGGAGAIVGAILGRWGGHAPARHENEQSYAPPGMREGGALAADITPEDEASPLPTDLIAQGKMTIGAAAGTTQANETLRGAGVPDVGTRVSVSHNGKTQQGAVADAWTVDVAGQTSVGVKIRLDDGTMIEEPVDTLRDMGVTITPHLPEGLPEGDLADPEVRRLAAQGMEAVEAAQSPAGEVALPDAETPNRAEAASGEASGAIPGLPVNGPITSPFGHRTSPKAGASTEHAGVDIGVPAGTAVKAPAAGIVLHTGSGGQRGNWVELDHGDGTITRYMHLSEIDVERGDRVNAGQAFAKSGATGNATGPHLHYSVIQNGQAVDPMKARFGGEAIASNEPAKAATTGTEAPSNDREARSSVQPAEPAEQDHGAALAGEPIDEEYTAFAPETGTLGIPRAEMPQIKAEHRGAMVNFLNARGIEHEEVTLPANEVKPTQAEFSPAKVEKAKAFEGGDRAILIDQAGHVVDGHHQYVAAHDLGEDIRAIRLKAPVRKIIDALREMPSVETEGQPSGGQLAANSEPQNIPENIPAPSKQDAMKAKMAAKTAVGPSAAAFDEDPVNAIASLPQDQFEQLGAALGVRSKFVKMRLATRFLDNRSIADVRHAYLAIAESAATKTERPAEVSTAVSKQDALKERMKAKRAPTQHNQIATDASTDNNRPAAAEPAVTSSEATAGERLSARPATSARKSKGSPAKPVSVIAFVRRIGGIKDNEGHNLSKGRGLRRHPGLINNKTGRSIDAIGEALWEAGYIGTPADRPTEAEVLDLLDEADRRPVYTKHEQEPAGQQTREEKLTAQEADAEHDIRTVAGDAGLDLNGDELASALHYYLSEGITAQEAIERTIYQSAALDLADIAAATRSEYDYADVADKIFAGNEAEARGGAEESGERPVDLAGAAAEGDAPAQESRTAPAAEARAPDEGRDSPGSDQLDAFGEQPGDQRRALEQQAEGRLRSDRIPKAPGSDGGLFDTRDTTGDLLEPPPAPNNEPSGPRSGQAEEENRGSSAESPPRPGLTALFDDEDTARQIGWLDPKTGAVEPVEPGTASATGTDSSQVRAQDHAGQRRTVEIGQSDVDRIRARLLQRMGELGLKDRYSLEVANGLKLERDHTRGQIDLYRKIISIALDRSENPGHSLDHEAIHALGPSGLRLITPAEWDVLVEAAWADDRLREWAQTAPAYQHLSLDDQKEEAAAEYVADAVDAMRGRAVEGVPLGRVQGTIYRAVHRVARFWNALRHAVSYLRTGEAADLRPIDVVLRIDGGEVGKRVPALGTVRGRPVTVTFGKKGIKESLHSQAEAPIARATGLPPNETPLSAFGNAKHVQTRLKAHPDYRAAKAGDTRAAMRLARDLVPKEMLAEAKRRFAGATFVPVIAEEATGDNRIPHALARLLANAAQGDVAIDIIQDNRAFHTGAAAMDRLISRPLFDGPVVPAQRYVIVDDVTVMGGTLAELANHLQQGGGEVIGTALLVNASRNPVLGPNKLRSKAVERRFGDVVRNELGVEPAALTGPESLYLLGFRDADSLRARIAKAKVERSRRLAARGIGEETGAEGLNGPGVRAQAAPPPGGIPGPLGRSFDDEAAAPPRLWAPVRAILDAAGDGGTSERVGEAIDRFRAVVQDRMLPVLRTQARIERMLGRALSDDENPYLGEELLSGRTGARLEALTENHVEPLFEEMRKAKVSPDELETFLYARHAPERNARIAAINPEFGEGEGSGMSDAEAADIMAAVDESGKRDALEQLAARVDAINAFSVQTRVESGLLSQDEANIWRTTYQHYVPLRGRASDAEAGNVDRVRRQTGISVKGKESRRAFGRKSRAADILPYTILQAEEAIARAEQNEVAKQFLELAKAAPDPDFWRVDKIRRVPVFNKGSGQVSYRAESRIAAEDAPYTVSVKVDGDEHRVTMNRENPSAVRVAEAMRNLNAQQFGVIVRTFGAINRFLSAINTSYSPEFVVTNALRDLQTATINLSAEKAKGMVLGVLKDYPAALKAATKGSFGKGGGAWGKWYQEFKLEGGRTYFNQGDDLAVLRGKVERAAKLASTRFGAKHMLIAASHLIEGVNAGVENALRLATYKNAREAGLTAKQAASMAKNVTVNFNRKGSAGPVINALYLFFNASMQGNARILMAMKSRKVQAILFSAVLMGFWLQLLNSLWSDRDDDGEAFYDKIPEFEKARNLILMLPGEHGRYVKLPLPWGYNVFPNLGRMMARMYQGERGMTAIADWAKGLLDAFNPVGGSNSLLNLISPTITDPIVDLVRNRDFADKPIMPDEKQFGPEIPDAQRYWGSVPPYWKAVTDFLAHETGGDAVRPGAIDISPETLDYLQQTVLGAAGNLVRNGMSIASKLMSDDPTAVVTTAEIPFERKVVGDKPSWYDKAAFYARLAEVEQAVDYGKKYIKSGDDAGLDKLFADQGDVLELETAAKHARKEMRGIRKEQRTVDNALANDSIDDETARIATAMLDAKQQDAITAFNARYIATVKQPLRP